MVVLDSTIGVVFLGLGVLLLGIGIGLAIGHIPCYKNSCINEKEGEYVLDGADPILKVDAYRHDDPTWRSIGQRARGSHRSLTTSSTRRENRRYRSSTTRQDHPCEKNGLNTHGRHSRHEEGQLFDSYERNRSRTPLEDNRTIRHTRKHSPLGPITESSVPSDEDTLLRQGRGWEDDLLPDEDIECVLLNQEVRSSRVRTCVPATQKRKTGRDKSNASELTLEPATSDSVSSMGNSSGEVPPAFADLEKAAWSNLLHILQDDEYDEEEGDLLVAALQAKDTLRDKNEEESGESIGSYEQGQRQRQQIQSKPSPPQFILCKSIDSQDCSGEVDQTKDQRDYSATSSPPLPGPNGYNKNESLNGARDSQEFNTDQILDLARYIEEDESANTPIPFKNYSERFQRNSPRHRDKGINNERGKNSEDKCSADRKLDTRKQSPDQYVSERDGEGNDGNQHGDDRRLAANTSGHVSHSSNREGWRVSSSLPRLNTDSGARAGRVEIAKTAENDPVAELQTRRESPKSIAEVGSIAPLPSPPHRQTPKVSHANKFDPYALNDSDTPLTVIVPEQEPYPDDSLSDIVESFETVAADLDSVLTGFHDFAEDLTDHYSSPSISPEPSLFSDDYSSFAPPQEIPGMRQSDLNVENVR